MDIIKASNKFGLAIKALVVVGSLTGSAYAALITPAYDTFGPLPEANWGGSGIPNDAVAISEYTTQICTIRCRDLNTISLGLSSHGRYENLLESNDGAGTFYASAGSNVPPSSSLEGATWNFNFFVNIVGDYSLNNYDFNLYYDFDPVVGNAQATHGVINLNMLFQDGVVQGSQNLMFGFLSDDLLPFITSPAGSFNPDVTGEYTFALTASDTNGTELTRSAMRVVVNAVDVPVPASLSLMALGLFLLRRRIR
ncbi:hypothetical protein [Arsukibacterium sp.]|uniref:hypothetical protein n=1 Tax=Arsukibacterium sp. TaxID=1977258 RepID=UPI001BD600DB|nr:hypothetical protein [Arsukibacterium sp.]